MIVCQQHCSSGCSVAGANSRGVGLTGVYCSHRHRTGQAHEDGLSVSWWLSLSPPSLKTRMAMILNGKNAWNIPAESLPRPPSLGLPSTRPIYSTFLCWSSWQPPSSWWHSELPAAPVLSESIKHSHKTQYTHDHGFRAASHLSHQFVPSRAFFVEGKDLQLSCWPPILLHCYS